MSDRESGQFLMDLAKYTDQHPEEVYDYIQSLFPDEYSVHSLVFDSLTHFSTKYFQFIQSEFSRLLNYAKSEQIDEDTLCDVFDSINLEAFYKGDFDAFNDLIIDCINSLSARNEDSLNEEIISRIEDAYWEVEKTAHTTEILQWKKRLYAKSTGLNRKRLRQSKEIFEDTKDSPALRLLKIGFTVFYQL